MTTLPTRVSAPVPSTIVAPAKVQLLIAGARVQGPRERRRPVRRPARREHSARTSRRGQKLQPGSYGIVRRGVPLTDTAGFGLVVWALPTRLPSRRQVIVRAWHEQRGGFDLGLDRHGRPVLVLGDGEAHSSTLALPSALELRVWHRLAVAFDRSTGRAWLAASAAGGGAARPERV